MNVGGTQKDVLIQAFQRRVLVYTPTNNDPFKVEFSNRTYAVEPMDGERVE
jgi:hypothetical protein